MGKLDQYFHICLRSGPRGLPPPPLTVSLTVKRPFFFRLPLLYSLTSSISLFFCFAFVSFLFDILQNSTDVLEADHICCFCFWLFQNSLFGRSPLFLFFFCDPNSISFFFVGASSLSGEHFYLKMLNLFSKRDDILVQKKLIGCVASLSPKLVNYCWCKLNINFVFVLQ